MVPRYLFFFFNDTATTEIYTLSLHDALPISSHDLRPPLVPIGPRLVGARDAHELRLVERPRHQAQAGRDRKSTRLNSSHGYISYAVFCLKKKTRIGSRQRPNTRTSTRRRTKL